MKYLTALSVCRTLCDADTQTFINQPFLFVKSHPVLAPLYQLCVKEMITCITVIYQTN